MKRLEKGNDTLANLTGQSLRLEPTRLRRNNRTTDFAQVRIQAESLYRGLRLNWCCTCKIPHTAILRLEARTSGIAEDSEPGRIRFRMVFSFDVQDIPHSVLPWKSKETHIESVEEEDGVSELSPTSAHSSPLTSTSSLTLVRPRRAVRWGSENSQSSSTTTLTIRSSVSQNSSMVQIKNLCSAFKDCKGTEACLGFLVDEKQMRHGIYPILQSLHREPPTAVTLYRRLANGPQNRNTKLTRKERLKLALTLASSVLQLHKTPWLNERWGKSDILFLEGNNGPYISRTFLPMGAVPAQDVTTQTKPIPLVRNETIFALGVILIELCLGQALETMREPEDLGDDGLPNSLTDYMTARRLVSEVYDEGGGRYGDAVRRCIHCEFDQRNASLDVEAFRQSFFQGVIQPLEVCISISNAIICTN